MTNYETQLERVKRFYARVQDQDRLQVDYEDDVWSFFIHAWHLKDYLDKFLKTTALDFGLWKEIDKYESLKIAHDVANLEKHYTLEDKLRPDGSLRPGKLNTRKLRKELTVSIGPSGVHSGYNYILIDENGNEHAVLDVGKEIIIDWQKIILAMESNFRK